MSYKNRSKRKVSAEKKAAREERRQSNISNRKYVSKMSSIFQFLWVLLLAPRALYYVLVPKPMYSEIVIWSLMIIAIYIQVKIYRSMFLGIIGHRVGERLITNGWFRYSRHPMYTLVLLADIINFCYVPFDWKIGLSTLSFYLVTAVACYYHEGEVLSNFGEEAKVYYAKTPRLIFMYPFRKWILV